MGFQQFENVSFTGSQYNDELQISAVYSANNSEISFDGGGGTDTLTGDFSHFTGPMTFVVAADGSITSNRGHYAHLEVFNLSGGAGATASSPDPATIHCREASERTTSMAVPATIS